MSGRKRSIGEFEVLKGMRSQNRNGTGTGTGSRTLRLPANGKTGTERDRERVPEPFRNRSGTETGTTNTAQKPIRSFLHVRKKGSSTGVEAPEGWLASHIFEATYDTRLIIILGTSHSQTTLHIRSILHRGTHIHASY